MPSQLLYRNKRKCSNCGRETEVCYTSCKQWDKKTKKMVYCGYLRIIRD